MSTGISTGVAIYQGDREKDLDLIRATGATWCRVDLYWPVIQRGGPDSFDFSQADPVIKGIRARGMKPLGILNSFPGWVLEGSEARQFAKFAAECVKHYRCPAYEIWNEPNYRGNFPQSAGTYTAMLRAAYRAIRRVDKSCRIISGGCAPASTTATSYAPAEWLRLIYANGGKGSFDAVGHHPYCFDAHTMPGDQKDWSAWFQMYGTEPSIRSVMADNGEAKKLVWATEFGAPTNGPGWTVTEPEQAKMISRALELWPTYKWAGPMFIYSHRDRGTDTSDRENFFGIHRFNGTAKPAVAAMAAASR